MKNFIFCHCLLTASMAKTTLHKVLFLGSMDSKRSKDLDESQFWALGCLLTGSGWLESIRAIMAPPCSKTYIPDLALDRVNILLFSKIFFSQSVRYLPIPCGFRLFRLGAFFYQHLTQVGVSKAQVASGNCSGWYRSNINAHLTLGSHQTQIGRCTYLSIFLNWF